MMHFYTGLHIVRCVPNFWGQQSNIERFYKRVVLEKSSSLEVLNFLFSTCKKEHLSARGPPISYFNTKARSENLYNVTG